MKSLKTYTQTDINGIIDYLSHEIRSWKPDIIVALAKGGIIPARLIARNLNISKILSYGVSFYDENDNKLDKPIVYQNLDSAKDLLKPDTKILVVDDIADSGDSLVNCLTYLKYITKSENVKSCALFTKPRSKVKPEYTFDEVDNDTWIVYPWE